MSVCKICLYVPWLFMIINTFGEAVVDRTMTNDEWISVGEVLIASHVRAFNARDVEALLKGFTVDIHRMVPGEDIEVGLTPVRKEYRGMLTSGTWPPHLEMKVTDVVAFCNEGALIEFQGSCPNSTGDSDGPIKGMVLVVNVNGDFKMAVHIFNYSR